MRRFKMQTLLRVGLLIGIVSSIALFIIFYNVDNNANDTPDINQMFDSLKDTADSKNIHTQNNEEAYIKETKTELNAQQENIQNRSVKQGQHLEKEQNGLENEDQEIVEVIEEVEETEHGNGENIKHSERKADRLQQGEIGHVGDADRSLPKQGVEEDAQNPQENVDQDTKIKQKVTETRKPSVTNVDLENSHTQIKQEVTEEKTPSEKEPMNLAVVACGNRLEETLIMIKSAVLVSKKLIHVHIFADDEIRPQFQQRLHAWKEVHDKLQYTVHPITYPRGNEQEWIKLFRPCATQRLFLPEVLTDVELILYVDTDVLFLQSMDAIWSFFDKFNSTHISALTPEHQDPNVGWYNRFARHPYYPPLGVNSGVMLMNLSRMREVKFVDKMPGYLQEYKYRITWGDQDLINIYFHFYPEKLLVYPCEWNYRPDHCMYMSVCKTAEEHGVQVMHGCREVFHNEKQPAFKAVYETFQNFTFGSQLRSLGNSMKTNLESTKSTNCGRVGHLFYKNFLYL